MKKIRLSLDLTQEEAEQIKNIRRKSRASTTIEAIRKAIALFDLVIDHQATKGKVILEDTDGTREVLHFL